MESVDLQSVDVQSVDKSDDIYLYWLWNLGIPSFAANDLNFQEVTITDYGASPWASTPQPFVFAVLLIAIVRF